MQFKTVWFFITLLLTLLFVKADDLNEANQPDVEDVNDANEANETNEFPNIPADAKPLFKELTDVTFEVEFPDNPFNDFTIGEKVQVQVNFTNNAEKAYILQAIYGFIIDPEDSTAPMANLTGLQYELKIAENEKGNVPYFFSIPEFLPEKQASILLIADVTDENDKTDLYKSFISEAVINLKEAPVNYYDIQTLGIILVGLGAVVGSLIVLKKALFGSKKSKVTKSTKVDQKDFLPPNLLKTNKKATKHQKSIKTQ